MHSPGDPGSQPIGQFADEEVRSFCTYPKRYKPKDVVEQTNRLHQLFPGLGTVNEKLAKQPLPPGAEGYFDIPRWEKLAPNYNEAVSCICGELVAAYSMEFDQRNPRPKRRQQHGQSVVMWQKLGNAQNGHDILVVPAQFGLRHRGRSIRRARELFNGTEFGLGAIAVGIMLLTHPDRLVEYNDLCIDCAGDECSIDADGPFEEAPRFRFGDDYYMMFDTSTIDSAFFASGSASGFLST